MFLHCKRCKDICPLSCFTYLRTGTVMMICEECYEEVCDHTNYICYLNDVRNGRDTSIGVYRIRRMTTEELGKWYRIKERRKTI